jgi:hypothetical protein
MAIESLGIRWSFFVFCENSLSKPVTKNKNIAVRQLSAVNKQNCGWPL